MMKKLVAIGLLLSLSAFAAHERTPLNKACLKKVVAAVNKHHTLAEGEAYALRTLYTGEYASVVLVGHSDETDPTDYLVSVEEKGCKVKSIVYANDASGVEEYTEAEQLKNLLKD